MGKEFFTFGEYMRKDESSLTASMEDYLEMIFRLAQDKGYTRMNDVATALNVQPPSATNMIKKLSELELLNYEKYGIITLNEYGHKIGQELLRRHNIIQAFLELLDIGESVHDVTEKIEHTINAETLKAFEDFINYAKKRVEFIKDFKEYRKVNKN